MKQVVAPKGLDISRPTIVVMPNYIGLPNFFSQGIQYIKHFGAATDKTAFSEKAENKQTASFCYGY